MVIELKGQNGIFGELKFNQESFQNFSKHSHESLNIVAVEKKPIEISYHKQEKQHLFPDQLALFNPKQVHQTSKENKTPIPYYSLHLNLEWALNVQKSLFDNTTFLPLSPNIVSDSALSADFIAVCKRILENSSNDIEEELTNFARKLFLDYSDTTSKIERSSTLERVENFILQNLQNSINIEHISKEVGYTSAHLNRLFKDEYGLTLHAFLIDKRIEKAKKLIRTNKDASLTEIAYEAGFFDQSHFIRNFKKVYSLSPKKYK